MDYGEATKTLLAYSASIAGKIRLCEIMATQDASDEAKGVSMIEDLRTEMREAHNVLTLIYNEVGASSEKSLFNFTDELAKFLEAADRTFAAIEESHKFVQAREEKSRDPAENPLAKAIRAFKAKQGLDRLEERLSRES